MPDIKISGTNNVFKLLEKPGYSIYFNTRIDEKTNEKKYKIIYKNDKNDKDDKDDSDITISNSVIFNTIYSHEINENDIPLVEYYNLLIETKSLEPHENSQSKFTSLSAPQPVQQNQNYSYTPVQQQLSFMPQDSNSLPIVPFQQDTNRSQSFDNQNPNPQNNNQPNKSSIITLIKQFVNFFRKDKSTNVILGNHTTTKHPNIIEEYKSRYPPNYKGPYFKIHAVYTNIDNLKDIDDIDTISSIAKAWNEYIENKIELKKKLKTEFETYNNKYDVLYSTLNTDGILSTFYNNFLNNFLDPNNGYRVKDEYRELSIGKYSIGHDNYYEHVNNYGYPIYRAYYKNIKLFKEYLANYTANDTIQITNGQNDTLQITNGHNDTLQITNRQTGGVLNNFTIDGKPLITDADWEKYTNDYINGSANFQPSSFQVDLYDGNSLFSPAISTETQSQITIKYAWDCKDRQITRFNGYYDMNYDRIKKDIFEYNENKNMNIKFYIFSIEDIPAPVVDRQVTIIILKTSDNKIDPIIVTSPEAFLQDIKDKLENKIIAKISTTTDVSDTYILFNVDIIGNIKDAKIYKEEDKYKYDFVNLNNDLKKIIEYYNTISNLPYFRTYSEIKKQLMLFKEAYEQTPHVENLLISIYKEELKLRISICDNIIVSSGIDNSIEKNIQKYKDLLDYTYKNIDNYPDKKDYFERINKCVPLLIDRVRYYGENFIY
jgi:hypothetical protein